MSYSKKTCNIKNFEFFGIWNIPKNLETRKKLRYLEYGIFPEYSKKTFNKRNIEIFGIWNITGIIKK